MWTMVVGARAVIAMRAGILMVRLATEIEIFFSFSGPKMEI